MKLEFLRAFALSLVLQATILSSAPAAAEKLPAAPDESATEDLTLEGLIGPVRIARDEHGLVHIRAGVDRDAYFAMGYVHAADRIFQMDYSRRLFAGTLAELMGPSALASDIQLRTIGLGRAAEKSLSAYSPETLAILQAYTDGVNAWLAGNRDNLPNEYAALERSEIESWTLLDTLTVMKGIAFGLSFDLGDIERTSDFEAYVEAGQTLGFDGTALFSQDLFRSAPFDPTISIPGWFGESGSSGKSRQPSGDARVTGRPAISRSLLESYLARVRQVPILARALERDERSPGSNFWIIGPEHSASGYPLFANDPHQALDSPSVFYEIHLTVTHDPARGPMNVGGISFPGVPGVVQGCNDRICWGSTVNPLDVTDVYQERLSISLRLEIVGTLFEDTVEEVVAIPQTFFVNQRGDSTLDNLEQADVGAREGGVTYLVPRRNMGPIVAVEQPNPENPFDVRGLSIQYTGWGPTREGEMFLRLSRAHDLDDFKEALQYFDFGSQNWGYADVDGNIAYFTSGELPLREDLQAGALEGSQPWFVRDGTRQSHNEWLALPPGAPRQPLQALPSAILPFDEMPQVVNPAQGYIANGNNDPVGVSLDNNVLNEVRPDGGIFYLNPGFTSLRVGRIDQMIRDALADRPGGLTLADLQAMQADHVLLDGQVLVPHILAAMDRASLTGAPAELKALAEDAGVQEAVERFRSWNFTTPTGIRQGYDPGDDPDDLPEPDTEEIDESVAATIFAVWRSSFVGATIDRTLERLGLENHRPDSERSMSAVRNLLETFPEQQGIGNSGIDFFEVDGIEDRADARDFLILQSVRSALDRLASPEFSAAFGGSSDLEDYRWGRLHRIRFDHVLGGNFSIPGGGGYSDLAPGLPGLARSGGYETVDASAHSVRASGSNGFMFGSGPARRFVAELDPEGIRAFQVIPGGETGRSDNPGYGSDLPLWLTNRYHSLDLGRDAAVRVPGNRLAPQEFRLFFPFYQGDASSFTGFAASNASGSGADLLFQAWDGFGNPAGFGANPAQLPLPDGAQLALLGSEIFNVAPDQEQSAWVELKASFQSQPERWPALGSFLQLGQVAGQVRGLDGANAQFVPFRELFFTRAVAGSPGAASASRSTLLSLANPSPQEQTITLQLFAPLDSSDPSPAGPAAAQMLEETILSIPGRGFLFESLENLFSAGFDDGYLRLVSSGSGVVGLGLVGGDAEADFLVTGPALPDGPRTLYSAQFAYGPSLDTSIRLINTSPLDRRIVLTAVRGGGLPDLTAEAVELAPGGAVELLASRLFPDQAPDGGYFSASLELEASGPGIAGDVAFGDFDTFRIAAALPLQLQPSRSLLFGHLALLPGELFTGFALFNPGPEEASATITVFEPGGSPVGEAVIPLAPGERIARTLSELIPELDVLAGGFARVESTVPLVGQELFGDFDLTFQSAVPPTAIE